MPEDSLAEPVTTSHFTGQQGQGPRLGPAPHPLFTLFLPVTTAGAKPQRTGTTQCQEYLYHLGYLPCPLPQD